MNSLQSGRLAEENIQFTGTGGISQNNHSEHFVPAFMDSETGEIALSCYKDGRTAPFHLMDGLPEGWLCIEPDNKAISIKENIISGFVRYGRFFNRKEAAEFMAEIA
ncbi:hypothetical protein [Neptuniibacter sp.]|uniref:hypothetical protein n=1 Tax=Neptuniibacter sp. TaxID=1962643 RepID=UPI00260A3AFA|nr:hypothetical protein [Neptuniibacter sp.]MCP4597173.1 hypothetical protein [Neptuniibacter sp.]